MSKLKIIINHNKIFKKYIKTSTLMHKNVLTHETEEKCLNEIVESTKERLIKIGNKDDVTVEERLNILKQLTEFEFGKYLLINKGLTGYWTRYINLYPKRKHLYNVTHPLEKFILEKSPGILASQERFDIFQKLLKENIKDGFKICSLPCGLMDDLLTLDYSNKEKIELIGIDIDENSTKSAFEYSKSVNLDKICKFYVMDAWKMNFKNEFNILTSNMLIQYVNEEEAIIKFYKLVFDSLKNNGIFIISCFLPPSAASNVDLNDSKYSSILFYDIIQAKWTNYQPIEKMIKQLKDTGFNTVEIYHDSSKRFPTLLAKKIHFDT